ncbi:glycosyltransferase family 1 protein [Aestuariivirga sp.]|uniref:glycosyltransferase family 4 protein n=1 Tax=Aestuariivirga sp. TaxID=2650926 RepID=UPI0025BD59B1|nr:glycosyltransferase family 1 protein [Aestuariivirga sp.]MCA3555338.1 glycosyltransferase family 1 protein [Aestuariivirga sp.]
MRILIVTDAWSPQVNGVVRTLNALIAELRAKGHDVRTIDPEGRPSRPLPFYREITLTQTSAAALRAEIAAISPDVIHIATEGPLGWTARRVCLREGLRFTTGFHTRFAEYAAARIPLPGVLSLGWEVLRRFHAPSEAVMAPTKSIGAELDRRKFRNVKIWTRGVDRTLFKPYPRDHLGLPRPIILYAGRLAVEKGIDDFIALKVKGSKVLAGDGPERQRLQKLAPDAHFLGFRHGEDYARTHAAADVMVFPSRTDTFGLVMLEAMACGTPVAAYNAPSPLDVVDNGTTGIIADRLDDAVERALVLDRGVVEEGSRKFSWRTCADLFESWLVPCGPMTSRHDPRDASFALPR